MRNNALPQEERSREAGGGRMKQPCDRKCPRRTAVCHATCPNYAEFVIDNENKKKAERLEGEISEFEIGRYERFKKSKKG